MAHTKQSSPLLSVIIPSYGRENSLHSLIKHFVKQAVSHKLENKIEIIVIDDGSIIPLNPYSQSGFPSVKWIRFNTNCGAPAARKYGFELSSGAFIHFHDSDDSIGDAWVKSVITRLEKSPQLDMILSSRKVVNVDGEMFMQQRFVQRFGKQPHKIRKRLQYNNCFGPLGGITFSKNAASRILFSPLPSCQDWDMYLDVMKGNTQIITDNTFYFIKNETSSNRISNNLQSKMRGFMQLGRKHKTFSQSRPSTRLFYVYHVHRAFKNQNLRFDQFCNEHRLALYAALIHTEIKKIVGRWL